MSAPAPIIRPLLACVLLALSAQAQPAAPAAMRDLLRFLAQSPTLAAARKRIDAARARTESAGRLADPEVEAMASRVNAIDNRDMWEVTVRQPLPKRGERAADRERARAIATLGRATARSVA